jgi:hypothetical protein
MHANRLALIVMALMLLLITTVFMACAGNGQRVPLEQAADTETAGGFDVNRYGPQEQAGIEPAVDAESINRVILEVPALDRLGPGDEFSAVISGEFGQEVHQGVLRLLYDMEAMTPLEIVPGKQLPQDMIRIGDLSHSGILPLAFTALPGARNIAPGSAELYRVRFRLLKDGAEAGRIRFRSDPEFLQLRNRDGEHIRFDVATRAGGRDVQ